MDKEASKNNVLHLSLLFLLIISCIFLWKQVNTIPFLSDDYILLEKIIPNGPAGLWCSRGEEFFRPCVSLTLYIDNLIWQGKSSGFHLSNLLIHLLNSILLILLFRGIKPDLPPIWPICGGLLFFLLASHSEAVVWISGRCDLLATTGSLLALLSLVRLHQTNLKLWSGGIGLGLMIALSSKESSMFLPFLLWILHCFLQEIPLRTSKWRFFAPCIFFSWILLRFAVLGEFVGGYGLDCHLFVSPYRIMRNFFVSPGRIFLPPLFSKYSLGVLSLLGLACLVFWVTKQFKNERRVLYFLSGGWILTILPSLSLWISIEDTQGERFLYLPSVFLCIFLVMVLKQLCFKENIALIVLISICLLQAFSLHWTLKNWQLAGKHSQEILKDISVFKDSDSLCIENLPDNIEGAYIFRNGISEAVRQNIGTNGPAIKILSRGATCCQSEEDTRDSWKIYRAARSSNR